jgi:metal-responsive CopG/Arc/MetJ family transcriptional regulator
MKSNSQTFNISFPSQLVEQIDAKAKEQFGSRSDLMRQAVLQYLRSEQQWEELFRYGQSIGAKNEPRSEEAVAADITKLRRDSRKWTQ